MSTESNVPDYDDVPNTQDLQPPTSGEVPMEVLALKLAVRAMRKDIAGAKRWFQRMAVAFITGSLTVAGSVVGVAMERGEERERMRADHAAIERQDERLTKLEERQWVHE